MQIFIAIIGFLISTSVFAVECPDFSGKYLCSVREFPSEIEMTIEQTVENGVTVFTYTELGQKHQLVADGKSHVVDAISHNEDYRQRSSQTVTCSNIGKHIFEVETITTPSGSMVSRSTFSSVTRPGFLGALQVLGTYTVQVGSKVSTDQISQICQPTK